MLKMLYSVPILNANKGLRQPYGAFFMASKTLIIAEKPSLGKAVAAWISKNEGVSSRAVGRTHIEVGSYAVSWLFGHVLENVEPHAYDPRYKSWNLADLPIIPGVWKLSPKREAMDQIRTLKDLLKSSSAVIGLGDPDQEGQLLQDEFLLWAGNKLPVKRLWLPAVDDASIAKAWAAMKPNSAYEGYYWSALARSHADWLAGINLSRACTLSSQHNGGNATLSVGRVQTPTLALIVEREKAIRGFKPVDYFTPYVFLASTPGFKAGWNPDKENDERLDDEGRLLDRKVADAIAKSCELAGSALVTGVKETRSKENPPLPFSLSGLQELMSRRHGMGVQDVLKYAQSLYEKKLASYPRTDCEYLPESQHDEASTLIRTLSSSRDASLGAAAAKADISLVSRAFNDKKVTAHHAIVPRPATAAQLSGLSSQELTLWTEIARRYVLQFFPAAEALNTEIDLEIGKEPFRAKGKVYLSRGWRDAFAIDSPEDEEATLAALPRVKKGDLLKVAKAGVDATTTKPPKRFTEGTLVAAMKNVHRYVSDVKLKSVLRENVGIGTEATRANVIGELFGRKFIVLNKKDIRPTDLGEQLIDALPRQLTAPDLTALWQQSMDDIRDVGQRGYADFIAAQSKWLHALIKEVPGWFAGKSMSVVGKKASIVSALSEHPCLRCKGQLKRIKGKFGWFFGCQNDKCKTIFKDVGGKPVEKTAQPLKDVLEVDGVRTGDRCPKCKKGTLRTSVCGPASKAPGRLFLSCTNFTAQGRAKCTHSLWPR